MRRPEERQIGWVVGRRKGLRSAESSSRWMDGWMDGRWWSMVAFLAGGNCDEGPWTVAGQRMVDLKLQGGALMGGRSRAC